MDLAGSECMFLRRTIWAAAFLIATAGARAEPPAVPAASAAGVRAMAPIPDPEQVAVPKRRPGTKQFLSDRDREIYARAFEAGDRRDWNAARGLAAQGADPVARDIIEWRYRTDAKGGARFDEIDAFLRAHPDWPLRTVLESRAEETMHEGLDAGSVIGWFGDRVPHTGMGKLRLGEASIALGQRDAGRQWIQRAWIEHPFEPAQEYEILRKHGDVLTPAVHKARLENLLWNDDALAARRAMERVDSTTQRLAQARLAIKSDPRKVRQELGALPAGLRNDPGLLFDAASAYRKQDANADAFPLVLGAPSNPDQLVRPDRWWRERHLLAREAFKDRQYRTAYDLVARHGIESGGDFADAEFLAGWIALRFLDQPAVALEHFKKLRTGVSYPISRARAHYWIGRAAEALNRVHDAWDEYRLAAQNPEAFYGQLALARIARNPTLHVGNEMPQLPDRAKFESESVTRAIRVLGDLGQKRLLRTFALHAVRESSDPAHTRLVAELLAGLGERSLALRAAKEASYRDVTMLAYSHPVIDLPSASFARAPETALVLGLTRQESEFDEEIVSHAGARGLMQLMPATARLTAKNVGMRYLPASLTTDPDYNLKIGMAHLAELLLEWNGSYVLAIASYNAGKHNVKRWIETYGDPRSPRVDPVDWIELIPYGETRNYVQRVLENTEVYRNRVSGRDQKLAILNDLYRPAAPVVTVLPDPGPRELAPDDVPLPRPSPLRSGAARAETTAASEDIATP